MDDPKAECYVLVMELRNELTKWEPSKEIALSLIRSLENAIERADFT